MPRELERRIVEAESVIDGLPCGNPEHGKFYLLFYGIGEDRENDGRLESMRQCERCCALPPMVFILGGKGPGRRYARV